MAKFSALLFIFALSACATKGHYDDYLEKNTKFSDEDLGNQPSVVSRDFQLGAGYNYGSMENKDNIPSRTMDIIGLYGVLGVRFWSLVPFVGLQYQAVHQSAEPSQVNNQNLSGEAYSADVGFKYRFSNFALSLGSPIWGLYKLSKKTRSGLDSSYSGPVGYFLKLDYNLTGKLNLNFLFNQLEYSKHDLGGREIIHQGNLRYSAYGVGMAIQL